MKSYFQFKNLLGAVYHKGDIVFSKDGNSVVSPVGNKITIFDLKRNKSVTISVESKWNYTTLAISPNGKLLVAVNERGEAHLISLISLTRVHSHRFKGPVEALAFSPDGRFLAVAKGTLVLVYRAPGLHLGKFNPFVLHRGFQGPADDVTCLAWSDDSNVLSAGSKDGSVKVFVVVGPLRVCSLGGHTDPLISAVFDSQSLDMVTVARNRRLCLWEASIDMTDLAVTPKKPRLLEKEETDEVLDETRGEQEKKDVTEAIQEDQEKEKLWYRLAQKHWLDSQSNVVCACYCSTNRLLSVGFTNGEVSILELPSASLVHRLQVVDSEVSRLAVSSTGEWLAVASRERGQLAVWEWRSETYVMRQQGHSAMPLALSYSPDGHNIVSGGEDGVVKLWDASSGYCLVTFTGHTAPVPDVKFAPNGKVILSASLDGTVRAWDTGRYRNFRTLTGATAMQFWCVAIDSAGELVAAGARDTFDVLLWSLKIGRLLEVMAGHTGPVSSIAFNPSLGSSELATASWDKTIRIWRAVETDGSSESMPLGSDALSLSYKPDGSCVVVSTLSGDIVILDPKSSSQIKTIEGKVDLGSGMDGMASAKSAKKAKAFDAVDFSPDGSLIIAGGRSKNVCIYSESGMLLRKLEITQNHSLDGMIEFIHKKRLTEFGDLDNVDEREEVGAKLKLPGARKGDMSQRNVKPEVRINSIKFSPDGREWAACTTEGLLIYSSEGGQVFSPEDLGVADTVSNVEDALREGDHGKALLSALRLGDRNLVSKCIEHTDPVSVAPLVSALPSRMLEPLAKHLAGLMESSNHLGALLIWLKPLIIRHKPEPSTLTSLHRSLSVTHHHLAKVAEFNKYSMAFLDKLASIQPRKEEEEDEMDVD